MPSFLTKVFGRKKHDDKEVRSPAKRASDPSLLEGKFEAVSPNVSPSVTNFPANTKRSREESKETEGGFSALFRSKSRPVSPTASSQTRVQELPALSLNLPGPKDEGNSRALGVVFEADPDGRFILDDSVIGARRLNPLETLILVRACSQAIINRGLETLGIMHPHWYSASPEIQRRLISLFIQSLAPKSQITTLSPTPSAPVSAFESEINFTRSPHDVAAVLRWGLRHLKFEGASFGKDAEWYKTFAVAERDSSYPPKAFSEALVPQLPPAHVELLLATLEVASSLASHAEHNGISGSKLTKFLGLWLLTSDRAEGVDDWSAFYSRWERAGRMLEHLFLARIRDEALTHRMPTRLLELIKHYPYGKGTQDEDGLLARPRFSTRRYSALFVRVETELPGVSSSAPKPHPIRLIADAFKAESSGEHEHADAWNEVKSAASGSNTEPEEPSHPVLSRVFADDTIRLLSLIPAESATEEAADSTVTLFSPAMARPVRRRSFSFGDAKSRPSQNGTETAKTKTNGVPPSSYNHGKAASAAPESAAVAPPNAIYATDWAQFSTTGFGENTQPLASTLMDKDVEVSQPRPSRKSSRKRRTASRRSSIDNPATPVTKVEEKKAKLVSKTTQVSVVELDEAFIDFWSDALLDPISTTFPAFVICKLKLQSPSSPSVSPSPEPGQTENKPLTWLVIEQKFTHPAPAVSPSSPTLSTRSDMEKARPRPNSPRPSFKSDISALRMSSTFSAATKRFSFFSGNRTESTETEKDKTRGRKKVAKSPRIGEMGEILDEEEEKKVSKKAKTGEDRTNGVVQNGTKAGKSNGHGIAGVGTAAAGVGLAGAVAVIEEHKAEPTAPQPSAEPAAPVVASETTAIATEESKGNLAQPPVESPAIATPEAPVPIDTPEQSALTPAVQEEAADASKVGSAEPTPLAVSPDAAIEPSSQTEPIAEPIAEAPVVSQDVQVPDAEVDDSKPLPPAPESVVLAGETPGPQVALETSEPAALAQLETASEGNSSPELQQDERPVDHVISEGAEAAAPPDLEPVPIVENDAPSEEPHAALTDAEVQPELEATPETAEILAASQEEVEEVDNTAAPTVLDTAAIPEEQPIDSYFDTAAPVETSSVAPADVSAPIDEAAPSGESEEATPPEVNTGDEPSQVESEVPVEAVDAHPSEGPSLDEPSSRDDDFTTGPTEAVEGQNTEPLEEPSTLTTEVPEPEHIEEPGIETFDLEPVDEAVADAPPTVTHPDTQDPETEENVESHAES